MSYMTVKFLDKEYSIPEDVLAYIELLEFTDSVQKQLANAFVRKLRNEIQKGNLGLLGDEDLTTEIEQQVGKFIAKLCDKGIFTRTISDYLKDNKGYQLYSDVNKAALEKMKSLLIQEMDAWQAGYETAVNKAESHVTGMGFSIWSSSFVNHAIYAAMEASTLNKQGKEAEAQYQKDMNDLRSRLDSQYGGEKSRYINNTYIPNMEAALTVFAYELLDKYIADLIANGKFDSKTLDYVDIGRSNDLLKNLTLSHNKTAILESAFAACPYNTAVYMQAMKYELLDYETFQTAKVFKQSHAILSFLKESWGEIAYPSKFRVNYYCINILAQFTDRTPEEILRGFAEPYVKGILKAYSRNADMISDSALCYKVLESMPEDTILAGEAISKSKATDYVNSTVSLDVYTQLVEKCGHFDLLARIKKCLPTEAAYDSKEDIDEWCEDELFKSFEAARQERADNISASRAAEAQRKAALKKIELERRKRNIKIATIVAPIIAVVVVFVIVLYAIIIPGSKYDQAIELYNGGDYNAAIEVFATITGYRDSAERVAECQYALAVELYNNGDYYAAIELYNALGDYKDATNRCVDIWGKITARETISAEYRHTVALKENGTVGAVGDDQYGRTDVSDWTDIIAVSAGINYTLGLKSDGTVLAVGADNNGKCEVENWHGIVAIAAGTDHSVGLKSDGTVVAIGANSDDECEVSDWTNIIAIAVGDSHTVGLKADGTVVATGGTKYGRCDVQDWVDIVAISAADTYTLGLKSDGTVVAVGTGGYGLTIENVESWSDIVALSCGDNHILGLKSDGTVVATGENDEGQCNVSKWKNIVAIAAGYEHSVGLKSDGTAIAVGSNEYGQCNVSNWNDIILPSKADSPFEAESSAADVEYDEYLTWYNIEFASSFLGKELNDDGSLSMGPGDYEVISNDMYLFDIPGRFTHGMSSSNTDPVIVDILDWVTTEAVDNFDDILNPLVARYGDDYRVQHYEDAAGDAYMWKDVELYEYVICWQNADGSVDIRWTSSALKESNTNDLNLDENLKADLDRIKEYASNIRGTEANVLRDYPNFEDDGDTYYQCEDQVFGITGYYKFEYFEGQISSVRFTWVPADWRTDEEYVVRCLTECFGDYIKCVELLDDEWICYVWENVTDDNLNVSYYIAENEGEILIRVNSN